MNKSNSVISKTRKIYFIRLSARCIIFIAMLVLSFTNVEMFDVVNGVAFFKKFSLLHLLWLIWIVDMVVQLMPVKAYISIGSQKMFASLYRPIKQFNRDNLKKHIINTTISAYKVMIIWLAVVICICLLYACGVIDATVVVLISVFFYVCDLICVLIWCPFRLIMKNRCCTTCRIFNWDHFMMFMPLIMINSFFSWSLVLLSVVNLLVWEICVFVYPERFWANSNNALKCTECTDKLCTQYCCKTRNKSNCFSDKKGMFKNSPENRG